MFKYCIALLVAAMCVGYAAFVVPIDCYYAIDSFFRAINFSFQVSPAAFTLALKALFSVLMFLFVLSILVAERRAGLRGSAGSGLDLPQPPNLAHYG